MAFDYFYGSQGEHFRFYQIPAVMMESEHYNMLSAPAKILYSVLLNLVSLSRSNGWIEQDTNRVYIICQTAEISRKMGCSDRTSKRLVKELQEFGLIEKKRQGLGLPDLIFVKNFSTGELEQEEIPEPVIPEMDETGEDAPGQETGEKGTDPGHPKPRESAPFPEVPNLALQEVTKMALQEVTKMAPQEVTEMAPQEVTEMALQEVTKMAPQEVTEMAPQEVTEMTLQEVTDLSRLNNYNNINNPDDNYHLSIHLNSLKTSKASLGEERMDRDPETRVKEQIGYDILINDQPEDRGQIDELVCLMCDVYSLDPSEHIQIGGQELSVQTVQRRFQKLTRAHMQYILSSMYENRTRVANIRQYLLTVLYNAPSTMICYYRTQAQADLYWADVPV